jgi:hypothetical protein
MAPIVFGERTREPDGGRAFHGAETEDAAWSWILHGCTRFIREAQQPIGVVEQDLAGWREVQAFARANEKRDSKLVFELANARRDVGLHTMQPLGGAGHATMAHHGREYPQVGQVHASLPVNNII